ncbi:MAG: flagellar basal body rod protein FlgC [bacterium]
MISFIASLPSTTAALDAERTRLEVIAQNIANANTTHGLNGRPYHRQQVGFEAVLQRAQAEDGRGQSLAVPRAGRPQEDLRPGRAIYQPGHPDADENGMVELPNVNIYEEMADMIVASRTYEANVAVFKNSRSLAMQALSIGKG